MPGRAYLRWILRQCAEGLGKHFIDEDTVSACPIAYGILTGIINSLGGELSSTEE